MRSTLLLNDMVEKTKGVVVTSTPKVGNLASVCVEEDRPVQRPQSSKPSYLMLLSFCLQLQLCSAHCLSLAEQQLLGVLQSPDHLLNPHTHVTSSLLLLSEHFGLYTNISPVTFYSYQFFLPHSCIFLHEGFHHFSLLNKQVKDKNIVNPSAPHRWAARACLKVSR